MDWQQPCALAAALGKHSNVISNDASVGLHMTLFQRQSGELWTVDQFERQGTFFSFSLAL